MGKLASKLTKRIMASLLTIAMIMSNMTVYASEYSEPAQQTEEAVENTETDAAELPSTEDEAVQDDAAQEETADDETSQEGTEGDKQETETSGESSGSGDVEGDVAVSEGNESDINDETSETVVTLEEDAEVSDDIEAEEPNNDEASKPTLWIVGDSTVCSFTDAYYYPRYGYGTQIKEYLKTDSYNIQNLALSGRSSKSFITDEKSNNYDILKNGIKSGDTLVIGFGHNDSKNEQDRYTNPNGDYKTAGSFANCLYDNYVKMATDKGAEVIICTPIVRRNPSADTLTNSHCHIEGNQTDTDGNSYEGGDYPAAIRKLVSDVKALDANAKVSCVDLTALTKAKYEAIGKDGTIKLHAWTSSKATSVDNTHLNIYGAKMVAYFFAKAVKEANNTTLAASVKETLTEPTEADLVPNPDYKEVEYDSNLKDSEYFKDYVATDSSERSATFKGTAFGNLGGAVSAGENHVLETDSNGKMHIAVIKDKGKISSADDGIVMYYYKVPTSSQIEISAKATINNFSVNNQAAFGLMARDDMYIDINETGINSDYVVAGSLGTGCNCFYRKDGVLGGRTALATEKLEVGSSYNLSIKSNTDGYECVFGRETAQTGGYDFHLTSVDSDYIYIGMFASRNFDVTFSNIYLKVDDTVIVDQRATEYSITLENDGNGTVASNKASASKDEAVTLTATPKEGYMFKEYQITCGSETTASTDDQYTMPEGNVTIKAVFEQIGTEWNFQTDAALNTGINALKREGGGNTTTFYVGGLHVDATNGKWDSTGTASNGWVQTNTNTVINIPVKVCDYVKVDIVAYSADYTVDYDKTALNAEDSFICEGKTGNIRLDITGNTYIRSIKVTPDYEYTPPSAEKKIEVWDFGGKEETDADTYNNNVTKSAYDKAGILESGGTFKATSPTAFGDLTMYYNSGDRLYTNTPGLPNAGNYGYAQAKYSDYEAAGGWYCNGTGGSNRRYVIIANVHAGDKIVAYMGITQTSDSQFFFEGQGTASAQKDTVDAKIGEFQKYEFVAQYDGTYKIYENGAGKPMYHRIKRVPGVDVSGNIELNNSNITGYGLKFVNLTTKTETVAVVAEDGSFTATLAAGFSYRAVLTGAIGYGFTTESSNNIQTTDAESLTGKTGVTLEVETKDTYSYSGKIKGFDSNYDKLNNLKITMTPPKDSDANEVELTIDKEKLEFSADLAPDVEYSLVMEGVNDYEISAPTVVVKENENTSYENRTISVALRPKYEVAGGFMGLADGTTVTSLTFTNTDDNYAYKATIDDGGYSIQLRDGKYLVTAEVSNYSTKTHVVVNGGAVSRDILFVSTAAKGKITYASDIYVGYPKQTNNYATVSEAVEAAELMDRTADDAHRVTIHIAPGTYREQIIVKAPYISFVNDEPDEEVLLTWYYGIGYKYYSAASSKFYDAEDAYDKYDKNIADRWGCSVRVQSAATAFRAEGITFESSFNRYITDEELIDGVEVSGTENIKFVRDYGADVQSKEATERATALVVEADKAEFKNCGFYSSQDTLYTQGAHIYFKNCVIEGQTDYIFGSGNCIFDACELSWKGYSTGSQGGYITANRPADGDEGYLFRNCTVTANSYNNLTVTPGYFGRPWGANAKVAFINTKLQNSSLIEAAGWNSMSGAEPQNANYREYNTTSLDGKAVVTTSRSYAVIDKTAADALTVSKYFGSWTPVYYTADTTGTVSISGGLTITDNGDSNVPKPGHTLTVNYSLGDNDENDVSAIKWYIVEYNADGTEKNATLVKTSTAIVDKTYKITKDAVGKYIKVTVKPETLDGRIGTELSATTYDWSNGGQKCPVLEGYEDPSSGSGGITLGEGVNIFLAGDSTVKDYSAAGMYNGGKAQNLGAWGEFLQSFFNESEVKIQNYANGGRSTRNFINEGSLKKIEAAIGEGDYLFIQFGHNDASNTNEDRYVPVGTPVNGIYPTEAGTLVDDKYPDYTSGGAANSAATGTYKWFLQQYIDVAIKKGATPVVISPVSRQYYTSTGEIRPHHDDNTSSNNAYCIAAYQIYEDNKDAGCLWIDGFNLTKDLFEAAYKADPDATNGKSNYGLQVMGGGGDSTHNNKLGGMIEAMAIASAIQNLNVNISYAVKAPSRVGSATTDGTTVFSIDGNSKLAAYDILSNYESTAPYWEKIGQDMITAISTKSGELADSNIGDDVTAAPKAVADTTEDADGNIKITVTLTCDTAGSTIYYTADGSDPKKNEDKKTYSAPIVITEDTTIKAYATATDKKDSKVVTFEYSVTPTVNKPAASEADGARIPAGTVITLTADEGAVIRYTQGNNPEDPTIYSRKYSNGITVSADTTIKAIAVKGGVKSEVAVFKYTVYTDTSSITVNPPQFNPEPVEGNVALNTKVRLSADEGAVIYYTQGNNPADPTVANADIYDDEEGIVINKTTTIKAIAVKSGKESTVASATYTVLTTSVPETSTPEGVIDGAISITLTCDEGSEIWYTTDRSDPRKSESRTKYENPIDITVSTTVKAYAVKEGYADSDVVTWVYTMKGDVVETVGFSKEPYFNLKTPHPGNTLEVKYALDKDGEDISTIKWYVGETEITANANKKTYEIQEGDLGKIIKARVTPKVQGIKAGTYKEAVSAEVTASLGEGKGLELILETKEYTYTGNAIIPDYSVTYDGEPLAEGIDYTVKCSNNIKVSTDKSQAKITVAGKGNLSGNAVESFKITKKSLADDDTEGAGAVQGKKVIVVDGSKASPVLVYNGIKLGTKDYEFVNAKDKDRKWKANETGTIEIKAKDNGNFTGTRTLDVAGVAKNNDSKLVVTLDSKENRDLCYNGGVVRPVYSVTNKKNDKLVEDEDYIISFPDEEVTSAGKKTFTVIGISEKCVGTVTKSYTVKAASNKTGNFKVELNGTDIIKNKPAVDFVSTGAVLDTDNLEVTCVVNEETLEPGRDYTITYSGNKKVTDNAKFTITGQGNYKGVKLSGTYKIEAATLSAETVKVIVSDKIFTTAKMYKSTPCVIEKASGTVLKASNYTVEYFDDKDGQPSTTKMTKADKAGKVVWVKITGKGGYTGTDGVYASYTVKKGAAKKDLSTATISLYATSKDPKPAKSIPYTGEEVIPGKVVIKLKTGKEIKITLGKDEDGHITYDNSDKFDIEFFNNTAKGKASMVITSKDDATCIGSKTVNFTISAKDLKSVKWK